MAFTSHPNAGANSYSALTAANTYITDRFGYSAWVAATTETKQQGLVTVTTILESMNWGGTIVSTTQDLLFPRTGLVDRKGATVASNVIPPEILSALWLGAGELVAGRWDLTGVQQAVTALSSGGTSVQFAEGLVSVPGLDHGVPRVLFDQIAHLLAGRQGGLAAGVAYGTQDENGDDIVSDYEDNDLNNWGVTRPL